MTESKFQTIVDIPKFEWETGYLNKNMFIGSCFTENIGGKMKALNYNVDINPFGILYNPVSVANAIRLLLQKKEFTANDLIRQNNLWHSFFHHGKFSSPDEKTALKKINERIQFSSDFLINTDFLFITFGTAWIYKYLETGKTVSNCHKIPAKNFSRSRISIEEIVNDYNVLLLEIWKLNPELKVIFTVSPIRHWKDGAVENQRSKAALLLAIEQIIGNAGKNCAYFPSYEIVMDELRDYRFYDEDMLHISDTAIKHIWEKFEMALISQESREISKKIKKIKTAVNHKPINQFTKEYFTFLQKESSKLKLFGEKYPFIDLKLETIFFENQLYKTKKVLNL